MLELFFAFVVVVALGAAGGAVFAFTHQFFINKSIVRLEAVKAAAVKG